MEQEIRIKTKGVSCTNSKGEDIPHEIIKDNGRERKVDRIIIEPQNLYGGGRSFTMYVSEEPGGKSENGDGGGIMGEALSVLAAEQGKKDFPCSKYDPERDTDVYILTWSAICRVWDIYRGGRKVRMEITKSQFLARQKNMDIAIEKRLENREKRRQKRVRGDLNYDVLE